MQTSYVGRQSHNSAERVDFADDLAFCDSADCGVAACLCDGLSADGEQEGLCADCCRGVRSLCAGVACAYYYAIEIIIHHRDTEKK